MLPDMDGLEVLRRLRAESPLVPVVFLTAKDAVEDRIAATDGELRPADLRDVLGDESALVLCRRFVREGLLEVVR